MKGVVHCPPVFDSFLCWPPTQAGKTAAQTCPAVRLSDTSRLAFRVCGDSGLWLGRRGNLSNQIGWTNYTPCFPQAVKTLFEKMSEDNAQMTFYIAKMTRVLEIVGLTFSFIALLVSLFIFSYFRSLRNNRTKIHKSLFCAILLQVCIRLVLYIDQAYVRSFADNSLASYDNFTVKGIDNMPYLCEISYALLEYAITVMFMWMLIEGLYLNNVLTTGVLRDRISHFIYYTLGWGLPLILTMTWATVTEMHYRKEAVKQCWYGYNFLPIYWIVQGPRLAVVVVNFLFLINILRVLVLKLRSRDNSEVNKLRKAVRAALFLLPLLGITNALDMTEAPLESSIWQFAVWSFCTHFFRSFQGFFIALLYCFLNVEVRTVITKRYRNYRARRETYARQAALFRNGSVLLQFDTPFNLEVPPPPASRRRRIYLTNKPTSPEAGHMRRTSYQVQQREITIEPIGLREFCPACESSPPPAYSRQLEGETSA